MENQEKESSIKLENSMKNSQISNSQTSLKQSLKDKVKYYLNLITVEPLLICYIMPSVLASIAIQNFNLEKACRVNKNYSETLCDQLIHQTKNSSAEEIEIQSLVAYMGAWRVPLQTAIPAVTILFVGAWSDRTGKRKPCFLVPILGEFITSLGLILCTYYFLQWPLEAAGLIEALPPALTGGHATMFIAVFTYMADCTTVEDRTYRIGLVNTVISLALPVGIALSGTLLNAVGYYGVFTISACFYIVGFTYGCFRIHDKKTIDNKAEENGGCTQALNQFFDLRHVVDTFLVIGKKRESNKRLQIILLLICYVVVVGPVHGGNVLQYLYVRKNFQFDEVEYSIFSAYAVVVHFIGVLIALTIFSKCFKVHDSVLGVIASISKVLASFVYAFAPSKSWLYAGPAIEMMAGASAICMRSMTTKVVNTDEYGKISSLFGVSEALVSAIYGPIFATFYVKTVAVFAGAYCLLGAALASPSIILFLFLYKLEKAEEKENEEKKRKEEKEDQANENLAFEVSHF